jgi:hypothetical protein
MHVIMDTGPWVALIDRNEAKHDECTEWFRCFEEKIFTSEAILTEVLYLLNFSYLAQSAAIDFVLNGAITIVPSSLESLNAVKWQMKKYRNVPMDYADATLVCLAEDLSIAHVVTLDRKHFSIYRLPSKKSFVLLP